jgi:hypothetical protein
MLQGGQVNETTKIEVNTSIEGLYSLGFFLAFGAGYALHGSWWEALLRGLLSWFYIGFLWAKELK